MADDDIICRYGRAMHLVNITPELARQWLATANRTPDPGLVTRYADMMRNGTWELMQLPVVYRAGVLRSSWNRLTAVIEADMTVPMYVSDDTCPR
jgi:hypothetical protein